MNGHWNTQPEGEHTDRGDDVIEEGVEWEQTVLLQFENPGRMQLNIMQQTCSLESLILRSRYSLMGSSEVHSTPGCELVIYGQGRCSYTDLTRGRL